MIERIISGGQTGADQAGWRAAKRFGIPTGGWMPKGWMTEDGPRPEFAETYGAKEHPSWGCTPRTRSNVHDAEATFWFGRLSSGRTVTTEACMDYRRPWFDCETWDVEQAAWQFKNFGYTTINIAGNRESGNRGIGARVEEWLCEFFRELGYEETG